MQVKEEVEFAVTLTDRPGSLAHLTKKLTAKEVDIEGFPLCCTRAHYRPIISQIDSIGYMVLVARFCN